MTANNETEVLGWKNNVRLNRRLWDQPDGYVIDLRGARMIGEAEAKRQYRFSEVNKSRTRMNRLVLRHACC